MRNEKEMSGCGIRGIMNEKEDILSGERGVGGI